MKLSGNYKLDLKKEAVWKALNDPDILKKCIPGCEEFNKKDNTHFTIKNEKGINKYKITYFDALYLSIVTQSTVGYGDITPNSKTTKITTSQTTIPLKELIKIIGCKTIHVINSLEKLIPFLSICLSSLSTSNLPFLSYISTVL